MSFREAQASSEKLTVGLIVDSELASKYLYQLAEWGQGQENLQITHLIIQKSIYSNQSRFKKLVHEFKTRGLIHLIRLISFRAITFVESMVANRSVKYKDHLKKADLGDCIKSMVEICPIISKSGYVYRFSDDDILQVKGMKLDVLVHCGSGVLRGGILQSTRFGVITANPSDVRYFRGGPPGFWEVFYKKDCTGFTIQQLTEEMGKENILFRGQFSTRFFYVLNQAFLYIRADYFLKQVLTGIATNKALPPFISSMPYFNSYFGLPTIRQQARYTLSVIHRVFNKFLEKINKDKRHLWQVAFAKTNWNSLVMMDGIAIPNPPGHFLADPFVIDVDNRSYCFVEDFDEVTDKGSITVYELHEDHAERIGEAISEPFHMSFPYVFEYQSKIYMVPETFVINEIRLYECVSFPLEWKLKQVLMSDVSAADTMLLQRDGLWWLFTNIDPLNSADHCLQLSIFYSESLFSSEWHPHTQNPIFVDSSIARNAGVLVDDNSVYRVSQHQGFDQYGKGALVNRISILNKAEYLETFVMSIEPHFFKDLKGTHHIHSDGRYTVFDFI